LLIDWFPDATAAGLKLVAAIDRTSAIVQETVPLLAAELNSPIRNITQKGNLATGTEAARLQAAFDKASGSTRTWLTAAKLASLLPFDPLVAELQLRRLKYSRTEVQGVGTMLRFLPSLCAAPTQSLTDWVWSAQTQVAIADSPRQQYLFFQGVGAAFPAVAVLAIAAGIPFDAVQPLIQRFLTPDDPVAHPTPLLTGQDLMTTLNLPAGPQIGRLLSEIQLARAEGTITTATEALELARDLAESDPRSCQ
jgi:tRNA nucleotidyltransferase (CCA-adding enzyme)